LDEITAEAENGIQITPDTINAIIQSSNLADKMKPRDLEELGRIVCDEYRIDEDSRKGWLNEMREATDLARQIAERKTDASGVVLANVKMPIISSAISQFSSRALPNIVKGRNVVKAKIIGADPGGVKAARASRVSSFMNHQILDDMDDWESETDLLLTLLGLNGSMFRKVYRDFSSGKNCADLVLPEDLVVHYYAKSFEPRATHILYLNRNEIQGKIRSGEFLKHEYSISDEDVQREEQEDKSRDPEDTVRGICYLEQHRWWDLDGDGFDEPCIVTVHYSSSKVVRIVPRFDIEGVSFDEDSEKITHIKPLCYFVKYPFMRSLEGSFYEVGFGILMGPMCRAINTNVNQLIDAATKQNNGGGFIGKGLRLGKSGSVRFKSDEYHVVNSVGDDIRKNIVPFPWRGPSQTLFQLLGLMIDQTKELASMSDAMAGQNPPRDQPATTTLALIEQGLKVFGAVFKRVFLALKKEFAMLYRLNRLYMSQGEYLNIVDDQEASMDDWDGEGKDIVPIADESELTDTQRALKAQTLLQMRQPYNAIEIEKRFYEALGIEDYQKLLPPEGWEPPPDPDIEIKKAELGLKAKELEIKEAETLLILAERRNRALGLWAKSVKDLATAQATADESQADQIRLMIEAAQAEIDLYDRITGRGNGKGDFRGRKPRGVSLLEDAGPGIAGGVPQAQEAAGAVTQPGVGFGSQPGISGQDFSGGIPS
jgi:chaperonin GroES